MSVCVCVCVCVISKYFKMKYSFHICNRHKPEYIYNIKINKKKYIYNIST